MLRKHDGKAMKKKMLVKLQLTPEGIEKLKKELVYFQDKKLPEIEERLVKVREEGGEEMGVLLAGAIMEQEEAERKIDEIEFVLANATKMKKNGESKKVHLGSLVKVEFNGQVLTFTIVESVEANPLDKKISHESPVGQALIGATVGQMVEILLPEGKLAYRILDVS